MKNINYLVLTWCLEILNKEVEDEKKIDFAVGGQAVIEGVMMRSPNHISIAVRKPDGKIKVKNDPYQNITQRIKWLNIPLIRGIINLFEMMAIGTKAINYSANESLEEEEQKKENEKNQKKEKSTMMKVLDVFLFSLSFIVAIALSIFLFKFLPLSITTYLEGKSTAIKNNYIVFNLIDGILKMLIFLTYIFLLSLIKSFRRVFEYHGAEHKSIFAYENKQELNVENAKKQSRFHPRCGTSFILIVFTISIIVYTFVPKQELFINNLILRIAFLPLIAGISYEYLKLSAKFSKNFVVKAMVAPGLWFQKLTTKEPDDSQLEIGLESLKEALKMEKKASSV